MLDIPNLADATFRRQAGIYKADLDALLSSIAGDCVLAGCAVTAQGTPDMTVAVAAGLIRVQGYFCYVSAGNVTIAAADGTLDRIDLIACDWNGTLSRIAGTAAAKPVAPQYPSNSVVLAQVYVPAADTAIQQNQIVDKRAFGVDFFDIAAEFMGSSLSATVATSAGSIGECGWTLSGSGTVAAPTFRTSTDKHPGVLRSVSGGTSGNNVRCHFGNAANSVVTLPANLARMRFLVAVPTITSVAIKLGFGVDLSDAAAGSLGTAGAWVEFVPATSAKWRYVTRQGGTSTPNTDTGADVVAGNWYQFDLIRKQNGNWQFLKNGALMFEHTGNLPTTGGNVGTLAHTLTSAARNLDHDFFGLNFAPLGDRWS